MTPFRTLEAVAVGLPLASIDTDQLIPARYMKRTRAEGYGNQLLHDLRFDESGAPRPEFPLNDPTRQGAQILVARRNFGAGSSREAAVYALADYGIRCVIAPSFGDIFASNAVNNGLLPARVSEADAEALLAALAEPPPRGTSTAHIDLEAQTIRCTTLDLPFAIDPVWRQKLLNGWDDLDLTISFAPAIAAFEARDAHARPWVAPFAPARQAPV